MSKHTPDIYTADSCPICREKHEPRSLSYDGKGINACGMYRSRLATFENDAPEHLGPLFAASPRMLEALEWVADNPLNIRNHPEEYRNPENKAVTIRATIEAARGETR